jgi:hypothetical protein
LDSIHTSNPSEPPDEQVVGAAQNDAPELAFAEDVMTWLV